MIEDKGKCPHGEFTLLEGCPQCIAERRTSELADQVKRNLANDEKVEFYLVKVQYYSESSGNFSLLEYTYYSMDRLAVGDRVIVPVKGRTIKAQVTAIDVPESEIASFKDKVKTIPAGSIVKAEVRQEQEEMEAGLNAEGLTLAGGETMTIANSLVEETAGTAIVKVDPGTAPSFAQHLEAAKRMVEIAKSCEILTEADAKAVNDDLNAMAELEKAIDAERKTFTVPLNGYLSSINGEYKLITDPLTEAKQIYRKLLTAWKVEQQRKAAEVEKLNRDAIDVARRQAEASGTGEYTAEIKPVPVPFVPKLTRTDQGKSGLVDNWKFEIVDIDEVPREYMIPDEAMLNSIAKQHHDRRKVKGVRFKNEPSLRVTR